MASPPDIITLLDDWGRGNHRPLDRLPPLVYAELRRIAARQLRRERAGHSLQPTALIHEAYLRLVGQKKVRWLNVSSSTAKREWRTARAWLRREPGAEGCT